MSEKRVSNLKKNKRELGINGNDSYASEESLDLIICKRHIQNAAQKSGKRCNRKVKKLVKNAKHNSLLKFHR